jgi:hypothetical protein
MQVCLRTVEFEFVDIGWHMFYRSIDTDKDDTCFIEVLILIRMTHVL